jgi:hypothetical protein
MDYPNYLALYGADAGAILERLECIRITAAEIILGVEQDHPLGE